MPGNFNGNNARDTESAAETVLNFPAGIKPSDRHNKTDRILSVPEQMLAESNLEPSLEKRNRN